MKTVITDSGVAMNANWYFGGYGSPKEFMFEIPNEGQSIAQVARDVEGVGGLKVKNEDGVETKWDGYTVVRSISRTNAGNIQIILRQAEMR